MQGLAHYERRFRRAGLPLFIVWAMQPSASSGAARLKTSVAAWWSATLARAVPLLLLFAAVLFVNTEMWQVFSTAPAPFPLDLGALVVGFGTLFLVAQLPSEVRRTEAQYAGGQPLSRRQRVNVALLMLVSHALQVIVVTAAVFGSFVAFGTLAIGPEVRESWLGASGKVLLTLDVLGERAQGTAELLRVAGGVAGLSGLHYAIAVLTDATYRDQFLDRLGADMREVFEARAEYLSLRGPRPGRAPAPGSTPP